MFPNNPPEEQNGAGFFEERESFSENGAAKRRFSLCGAPAVLCFIVMALMLTARLLSGGALRTLSEKIGAAPLLIAVYAVAFLLPTLIFYFVCGGKKGGEFAVSKTRGKGRYIFASLLLLIVCAMLTQSLRCYFYGAPSGGSDRFSETSLPLLLFCYAVLPAVAEECLFRGAILRFYTKRCGGLCAILVSSVLFSMSHFSGEDFVSYFLSGLILGSCAYVTGSLFAVIFLHLVNNVFSLYLENAVFKIATESKSIVLMLFLLTAAALLLLFWVLSELEVLCRERMLSAEKPAESALELEEEPKKSGFPRLIPRNTSALRSLFPAIFSPFFWGCVLIFIVYILLVA